MKSPEKMVTIAENMSKVKASGLKDAIAGDIKTTANVRIPDVSIKSKLQSVADGVKNTYESGVASAEKYKRNISGSTIAVNDANSIEHDLEVGVRSKNLIPFPYIQAAKELNGIIVTANDNGSVGVSGTATADATIYFDLCVKDFGAINMYSGYVYDNGYVIKDCNYDAKNKKTFIVISVKSGVTVDKIYYPQIELGSTATPYTPYKAEFEGVEVSRYEKNLFDIATTPKYSGAGIPTWNDGILEITQTALTSTYISSNFIIPVAKNLINKKITVSAKAKSNTGNEQACIRILHFNKGRAVHVPGMSIIVKTYSTEFVNISASGIILELPEDKTGHLCLALYSNAEGTITNGATSYYKDIQIEINDTATEYESYKEPQTATSNSEGVVEGLKSLSPNMTLMSDTEGVIIDCEYYSNTSKQKDDEV